MIAALLLTSSLLLALSAPSSLAPLVLDGPKLHRSLVTRELEDAAVLQLAPVLQANPSLSTDAEFVRTTTRMSSQGRLDGEGVRAALYALYLGERNLQVGLYGLEAASYADADRIEIALRKIWAHNNGLGRAQVHRRDEILVVAWHDGISPSTWKAVNSRVVRRMAAARKRHEAHGHVVQPHPLSTSH